MNMFIKTGFKYFCVYDFQESIATSPKSNVEREERLSTLPFLLHIATSSPDLLRGTITEFITACKYCFVSFWV